MRASTGTAWPAFALLHHALGDSERARHEADAFLVSARRWGTPGAVGQALHTSGVVQGGEPGLALMQAAIEQLECSPARLQYAYALVDYGAALRRRGDRADAREPLRRGSTLPPRAGRTRWLSVRARSCPPQACGFAGTRRPASPR